VLVFRQGGVAGAMLAGTVLPLHLLHRAPGASLHRAQVVVLTGAGVPAQADGDAAGMLPLRVEDAPHPIRIMVG